MKINKDLIIEDTNTSLNTVANYINNHVIESGITGKIIANAQSRTFLDITFDEKFKESPIVLVSLVSSSGAHQMGYVTPAVYTNSVTTTGFRIVIFNADTTGREPQISWIAIGK